MDWTQARYIVEVEARREPAVVKHRLEACPELEGALSGRLALWVTELRCPRTLLSRQVLSREPEQAIKMDGDDVVGDAFLIPGLVAVRDLELDPSGLNRFVWPSDERVRVPAGWWLARGDPRSTRPLTASLVRFRRDSDGRLGPGQMLVEEDSDGGLPFFRVTLAKELFDKRRDDRDVQIAGLVGACGRLPRSTLRDDGENAFNTVTLQLQARFEEAGIPDWNADDFDPAHAATVLEAFSQPLVEEEED
ncbi:MAG: hypothetical protein OXN89_01165 [Bryobacterales bacterium]|nr:hypothetical protein [Bryobacterales bacterium]